VIETANPKIVLPSRTKLTTSLIPARYEEVHKELQDDLKTVDFVALTTDTWTSLKNRAYITITAHYTDSDVKLQSKKLVTLHLTERHTANNLATHLEDVAIEFGIVDKVVTVTTDGGANVKAAVRVLSIKYPGKISNSFIIVYKIIIFLFLLGLWIWVNCFAHGLNLVVRKSIASLPLLEKTIKKCKDIVTYFHSSQPATEALHHFVSQDPLLAGRCLQQEVSTRWNSLAILLQSMVDLEMPLSAALGMLHQFQLNLEREEWDFVKEALKVIDPMYKITRELSSQKYTSISKVCSFVYLLPVPSQNEFDLTVANAPLVCGGVKTAADYLLVGPVKSNSFVVLMIKNFL
jgi:hypothetical protein